MSCRNAVAQCGWQACDRNVTPGTSVRGSSIDSDGCSSSSHCAGVLRGIESSSIPAVSDSSAAVAGETLTAPVMMRVGRCSRCVAPLVSR
eukprot:5972416-Prymnesium_polylepis.1